ncbi:MAG: hypothetical protein U0V03_07185 [Bacteroidia bacterium]
MKKILAILFCLTIHKISNAQVNYVVNGGFEQMDSCILAMKQPSIWTGIVIEFASPWDTLKAGGGGVV